jgi:outer membrane biosynthesis protein TonB
VLVVMLAAVLAAIALLWNVSRQPAHTPVAPIEVENVEAAAVPPPATPEAAPAVSPAAATEPAASERNQADVARVIQDGGPYLKACYQRALARDSNLVQAKVKVRVSIAASGKVTNVAFKGPSAFRELEPCLEQAISQWTFPPESEPYVAEFPIQFRGKA